MCLFQNAKQVRVWEEEEFQEEEWSIMADEVQAATTGGESPSTWTREESGD